MAAGMQQFRSSLNGFNRYDVVSFIETMTNEHEREKQELKKENSRLAADAAKVQDEKSALLEQIASLEAEKAELEEVVEVLQGQIVEMMTEEPADDTEDTPIAEPTPNEQELEAYRRAEAVERNAVQRANRLYEQMTSVCSDLNDRMTRSDDEIKVLYSDLSANLSRLQDALADMKLVFDDAPERIKALDANNSYE